MQALNNDKLNMKLKTDYDFINLDNFICSYEIKKAGKTVLSGCIENIKINPSEKGIVKIDMKRNEHFPN